MRSQSKQFKKHRRSQSFQNRKSAKKRRQLRLITSGIVGFSALLLIIFGIRYLVISIPSKTLASLVTQTPHIIVVTATQYPELTAGENFSSTIETASPSLIEEVGLVVDVIDGDTIKVEIDGQVYSVRYIGINTPEVQHYEWMGKEASDANRALVMGKEVLLEKDVSETDRFNRLLRYVYLMDGTFINAALVEAGFAESIAYPPDTKFNDFFDGLQIQAQIDLAGIWQVSLNPDNITSTQIQISLVNKKAEFVQITNFGDQSVNINGWILRSERGNQDCILQGEILPGKTLVIWAREADNDQEGFNCGFDENIWSNNKTDPATLINQYNSVVDRFP